MNNDLTRRHFLLTSAFGFGITAWARAAESSGQANAFSPLKAKLASGKNGILFINGDSTSYPEHGPYYEFAKSIGEATGCTIILHRWAEWVTSAPTGPKAYEAPVTLRTGNSSATLTVYLAALPGAVAGDMFTASRRHAALEEIPRPDACILHQGHNMMSYPEAFKGDLAAGTGLFLSVIGMTSELWPGVPQAIVAQNPWQNGDQYNKILGAIRSTADAQPDLTLIDAHQPFIDTGKTASLYRDNVHPSDSATNNTGAKLVAKALMDVWSAASTEGSFSTPSWPVLNAPNLIGNGDFGDWNGGSPSGWKAIEGATFEKSEAFKSKDSPTSLAIHPNGKQAACLEKTFIPAEVSSLLGKTISIAALIHSPASQPRAFGYFVCSSGGATRTFAFGDLNSGKDDWVWLVAAGISIDADAAGKPLYLRYFPAFSTEPPKTNDPLLIRKIVVTEGPLPKGGLLH